MTKLKEKIKWVLLSIKADTRIPELIFWWGARIALLVAAIVTDDQMKKLVFSANLLGTFAFTLLKLLAPRKSLIGRASFHIQSLIIFTSFIGYFIGHATDIHSLIDKYDFVLHLVSGLVMVTMGYYLMKAADKEERCDPLIMTLGAMGFSFMTIIAWEIFEFFSDYYIPDAANQAYQWVLPDDFFWFKIFGMPQAGAAQYPLFDTMIDIILAVITTVMGGIILYNVLKRRKAKQK